MPDEKPLSEPPTDRAAEFAILLEDIRSQHRSTIEAVHTRCDALERRMDERFDEQGARIDALESVVRSHSGQFQIVNARLDGLSSDMQGLRGDVQVLKGDVQVLKADVQVIKDDVKEIRTDLRRVETKVDRLESRFDAFEHRA